VNRKWPVVIFGAALQKEILWVSLQLLLPGDINIEPSYIVPTVTQATQLLATRNWIMENQHFWLMIFSSPPSSPAGILYLHKSYSPSIGLSGFRTCPTPSRMSMYGGNSICLPFTCVFGCRMGHCSGRSISSTKGFLFSIFRSVCSRTFAHKTVFSGF
jgi:hypothetical protein